MRLPDFLIIGAAKSGTTTLYKYLCRHPQICMSNPKEPDFFAIDHIYDQGIDWYSSLFSEARLKQVCGEASTTYTRLPK
ncbi:MAG: sulfotransferase domain-containing protein, partial [Symploca sp. SIO1C4]|nr:sulfotransferase domain-containing protein [Symploca sp. SIO1C4]